MEEKQLKDCPLCGEECFERFEEQGGKYAFVIRCAACSLIYGLEFKNTREFAEGNAVFIRQQFNRRAPQVWEQMTPDTKFEDGEWVCIKFKDGSAGAYQWNNERRFFHMSLSGIQYVTRLDPEWNTVLEFVRLPK